MKVETVLSLPSARLGGCRLLEDRPRILKRELLIDNGTNLRDFSECALMQKENRSQDHLVSRTYLTSGFTVVIALMLLVLGLCLLVLLFAVRLMERLGVTEINVVGRVFGVVLAALAVQYIIDGVTDVLGGLPGRMREWMTAAFWR